MSLIDDNVLQVKTGAIRKKGKQLNAFEKIYTADSATGAITLDVAPKTGSLKIYDTDANGDLLAEIIPGKPATEVQQYEIAAKVVTLNVAKKGKQVLVVCDYETGANADGMQFISGELPKLIRITAKTKVEDTSGGSSIQTIIIDKAKPNPSFTFETSAGNASVMPFECEVFGWINEDGKTQFFRMVTDADLK